MRVRSLIADSAAVYASRALLLLRQHAHEPGAVTLQALKACHVVGAGGADRLLGSPFTFGQSIRFDRNAEHPHPGGTPPRRRDAAAERAAASPPEPFVRPSGQRGKDALRANSRCTQSGGDHFRLLFPSRHAPSEASRPSPPASARGGLRAPQAAATVSGGASHIPSKHEAHREPAPKMDSTFAAWGHVLFPNAGQRLRAAPVREGAKSARPASDSAGTLAAASAEAETGDEEVRPAGLLPCVARAAAPAYGMLQCACGKVAGHRQPCCSGPAGRARPRSVRDTQ